MTPWWALLYIAALAALGIWTAFHLLRTGQGLGRAALEVGGTALRGFFVVAALTPPLHHYFGRWTVVLFLGLATWDAWSGWRDWRRIRTDPDFQRPPYARAARLSAVLTTLLLLPSLGAGAWLSVRNW